MIVLNGFLRYPFKHTKDKEIPRLVDEALWRKREGALSDGQLHSGDIKIQLRDDGGIQVWRLESFKL